MTKSAVNVPSKIWLIKLSICDGLLEAGIQVAMFFLQTSSYLLEKLLKENFISVQCQITKLWFCYENNVKFAIKCFQRQSMGNPL